MSISRRQTLQIASGLLLGSAPFAKLAFAGTATGTLSLFAGQLRMHGHTDGQGDQASFFDPRGLATDPHGNIVVADAANALIRRITPAGVVSTLAGGAEDRVSKDGPAMQARFVGPDAVAVAPDGTIYIADSYANTIRKLGRDGMVSTLAGVVGRQGYADGQGGAAQFNHPVGIAVDPRTGDVLVADAYNNTLRRITPAGRVHTFAGQAGVNDHRDGPVGQALFNTPVGIAVDAKGTIFVSEYFNQDVRKITPDGQVSTLAGNPARRGDADGQGRAALFRKPQQICLDAGGNIILADGGNHKVRRIAPDGMVTTLAGQGQLDKVELGPLPGALITPYGVAPGPGGSVLVSSGEAVLRIQAAA